MALTLIKGGLDIEEKWKAVKEFYESNYRVRFHTRLKDEKIEFLWASMREFLNSWERAIDNNKVNLQRLIEYRQKREGVKR